MGDIKKKKGWHEKKTTGQYPWGYRGITTVDNVCVYYTGDTGRLWDNECEQSPYISGTRDEAQLWNWQEVNDYTQVDEFCRHNAGLRLNNVSH